VASRVVASVTAAAAGRRSGPEAVQGEGALAGQFRVFLAIPGVLRTVGFLVMLSHVQRGSPCTWEDFTAVERWDVSA